MRLEPTLFDVACVLVTWTGVLFLLHRSRAQLAKETSSSKARGIRFRNVALVSAGAGLTLFIAWLLTDSAGPEWLHAFLEPAALTLIGAAAAASGYAGWLRAL